MKEIQTIVRNYMLDRNKQKKYLAVFLVLAMLVSLAVSLGLMQPADSMTFETSQLAAYINQPSAKNASYDVPNVYGAEANNGWSPASLTEAELLIGRYDSTSGYENRIEWADGLTTAQEVIEAAKRKYFLGIASDFCVFLQGDFNPSGADCEGRVAVGGNIVFDKEDDDSISNDYNYQLGSGDYTSMTALINTDNYLGVKDFAHAIVGGYIQSINTLSAVGTYESDWGKRPDSGTLKKDGNGTTVFFPEDEDLYKRFVVGTSRSITDCKHMTWPPPTWTATLATYSESCDHDPFTGVNELASFYQRDMIDFGEVFDWIGTQSEKLAKKTAVEGVISGKTVTFDGSSYPAGTKTYYFSLPAWDNSIRTVKFINVDETANFVVNCGGGGEDDSVKPVFSDSGQYFSTYINDTCISKFNESGSVNFDSDNEKVGNNYKPSEQILYNFYEATDVEISAHLNGTVLAPGADVTSDKVSSAHLSGSLIAQTFTGALEFGYRPYRGGTDILGSTAGYVVPFDKFMPDGNYLTGAKFVIKNENGDTVESWTSGEGTQFISIPTEIDFEGGTTYDGSNNQISHKYTVYEESAPEGFVKTDKTYTIVINETIDVSEDALIVTDTGTIPTKVWVTLELWEGDTETGTNLGMRNVLIRDAYSDAGIVQRIVSIQNGTEIEHFILSINPTDGSINSVGQPTDEAIIAELDAGFSQVAPSQDADIDLSLNMDTVDVLEEETTDESATGLPVDLMVFAEGDSITYGSGTNITTPYPTALKALLVNNGATNATVTNSGSPSYKIVDIQNSISSNYPSVSSHDVITLIAGTNNLINSEQSLDDIITAYKALLDALFTASIPADSTREEDIVVFVGGVPRYTKPEESQRYTYNNLSYRVWDTSNAEQVATVQANWDALIAEYNGMLEDVVAEYTAAGKKIYYVDTYTAVGDNLCDGIHPDDTGYANIASAFNTAICNYYNAEIQEEETTTTTTTTTTVETTTTTTTEDPRETPEYSVPTGLTATYGATLADVELPAADNGTWTWENSDQSVGNAGTNTFNAVFTPTDTETYKPVVVAVEVEVAKADPTYTVPTGLTAAYGKTLADVALPSGWTWADSTQSVGAVGTNSFDAVYTHSDSANYNTATESVAITVTKAQPIVNPVISGDVYTQGDTLPEISTSEGDTAGTIAWLTAISQLVAGENILTWEFTPEEIDNYEVVTGTTVIMAQTTTTTTTTIQTETIPIEDKKTATVVTVGEGDSAVKYYYDPASMMIMPLPDDTPSYVNDYGLVFKKLDDEGNLLPGAEISLQSGTIASLFDDNTEEDDFEEVPEDSGLWEWGDSSSSYTVPIGQIDVSELETGTVYRFYEVKPPGENLYETAPPIYFIKTGDTTVIYTADETVLGDTSKWTELKLAENREITMTDYGIYGAKVTLTKMDSSFATKLNGAEFELYALNGDEPVLVYPLPDGNYSSVMDDHNHGHPEDMYFEFTNGTVDLYEFFKSADPTTYNSDYVKGGYLVPDTTYYLNEVKAPSGYIAATGEFYFTVETDEENGGYKITTNKIETPDETCYTVANPTVGGDQKLNVGKTFTSNQIVTKIEVIVDSITDQNSHDIQIKPNGEDIGLQFTLQEGLNTFDKETYFNSTDVYINTNGEITINAWNCVISEIRFYTTPIIPDDYSFASDAIVLSPAAGYVVGTNTEDGIPGISTPSGAKTKYISVGSDYANKTITQIDFVISSVNGAGIQVKGNSSNESTGQYDTINPSVADVYEYTTSRTLTFDSEGRFLLTCWNVVIDEIRFYVEGVEASTEKPDLSIQKLTVYYLDGSEATLENLTAGDASAETTWPFDISALQNKSEIVGMKVETAGSGTGNITIGDVWTISGASGGETYTRGETSSESYVSEDTSTGTDNTHLVNVEGMDVQIGNEAKGAKTQIEVVKIWNGDTNFPEYRPESITVQLMRADDVNKTNAVECGDPVTLTASDDPTQNWRYTWTDLTGLIPVEGNTLESENPLYYYYYIEEIGVPKGYTVSYSNNNITDGSITITNKFNTISLDVEKKWEIPDNVYGITTPEVEVQLQKLDTSTNSWENIEGMTLKLNKDNSWTGEFTGLPDGETYRAIELNVPEGWSSNNDDTADTDGDMLTITNTLDTGDLSIKKIWTGDTAADRPGQIIINLYRSIYAPGEIVQTTTTTTTTTTTSTTRGTTTTVASVAPETATHTDVQEDYARLLQYSLYFYDAQMCGDEVSEESVVAWRNDCAVSYSTDTIQGGFHDAGDHVMFGLPQGFTASSLGWTFYEYRNSFDKNGLTPHYQAIMREFCDFFVNSTELNSDGSVKRFLYQKGNGGEHSTWGPPETAAYHTSDEFWTTSGASDIAAQYAAALAQYVINFGDPGNYLDVAKALYTFSTKSNAVATNGPSGFYDSSGCTDEQAWAAAWLYLATGIDSYKTDCKTKLDSLGESVESRDKRGYFWDRAELAASCVYNAHMTDTPDWDMVKNYLEVKITPSSSTYVELDGWATARHNTLLQLLALTYDKYDNSEDSVTYDSWAQGQMSYLLGKNTIGSSNGTCFVVGFNSNSAKNPHHRAASNMLDDYDWTDGNNWTDWNAWSGYYSDVAGSHTLLGALVGGPIGGSYNDSCTDAVGNEVALDYNAGLVGAAAALYDVYGTGNTVTQDIMEIDGLDLREGMSIYESTSDSVAESAAALASFSLNLDTVSVMAGESGSYVSLSDKFDTVKFGETYDITSLCSGLEITAVEFVFSKDASGAGNVTINGIGTGLNPTGSIYKMNASEFTSGINFSELTSIIVYQWGITWDVTLTDVRFYTAATLPSITITGAPTSALRVGDTVQLTATDSSNTLDIQWKSSDESLATVDSTGNVTITGAGGDNKVTITAYDSTDESISASVDINITPMTMSLDNTTIVVGDAANASFNNKQDSWTASYSFNPTTGLTAIGDKIVGQAAGNYTITATAGDGTSTATASAQLTVQALQISGADSITVDGGTETFTVNGTKNNLTWESLTPDLLTIDSSGVATAVKSGTATIRVSKIGEDGETYTAEKTITVNKAKFDISVDENQIRVGDTATLTAYNTEGGNVVYTSSSDAVATVTDGVITAHSPGTAIITGTLGSETDTVEITVVSAPVITADNYLMNIGDTLVLTASNILGNASWEIVEGASVLEIVSTGDKTATVKALANGTAKIKVTDSSDSASSEPYEITVTIVADNPKDDFPKLEGSGTAQVELVDKITLYPSDLQSDGSWTKLLEELPKTDGNGNTYYYYIAEMNGSEIATQIQGNGAIYVPVKYEGAGSQIGSGDAVLSVENFLTEKIEGSFTMPSTGGEGTDNFYIYGITAMLIGMAGFIVTKRRKGRRC